MDRSTAAHHLAKVFAFLGAGRLDQARHHAAQLAAWLLSL